jgi:hypothetical protein
VVALGTSLFYNISILTLHKSCPHRTSLNKQEHARNKHFNNLEEAFLQVIKNVASKILTGTAVLIFRGSVAVKALC